MKEYPYFHIIESTEIVINKSNTLNIEETYMIEESMLMIFLYEVLSSNLKILFTHEGFRIFMSINLLRCQCNKKVYIQDYIAERSYVFNNPDYQLWYSEYM